MGDPPSEGNVPQKDAVLRKSARHFGWVTATRANEVAFPA